VEIPRMQRQINRKKKQTQIQKQQTTSNPLQTAAADIAAVETVVDLMVVEAATKTARIGGSYESLRYSTF